MRTQAIAAPIEQSLIGNPSFFAIFKSRYHTSQILSLWYKFLSKVLKKLQMVLYFGAGTSDLYQHTLNISVYTIRITQRWSDSCLYFAI